MGIGRNRRPMCTEPLPILEFRSDPKTEIMQHPIDGIGLLPIQYLIRHHGPPYEVWAQPYKLRHELLYTGPVHDIVIIRIDLAYPIRGDRRDSSVVHMPYTTCGPVVYGVTVYTSASTDAIGHHCV